MSSHSVDSMMATKLPADGQRLTGYFYHTPKYLRRPHHAGGHRLHLGVLFEPFGDVYRHDKRMRRSPTRRYMDLSPQDGKGRGITDGDYVLDRR